MIRTNSWSKARSIKGPGPGLPLTNSLAIQHRVSRALVVCLTKSPAAHALKLLVVHTFTMLKAHYTDASFKKTKTVSGRSEVTEHDINDETYKYLGSLIDTHTRSAEHKSQYQTT